MTGYRGICKVCWNIKKVAHNRAWEVKHGKEYRAKKMEERKESGYVPYAGTRAINEEQKTRRKIHKVIEVFRKMCRVEFKDCKECGEEFMVMNNNAAFCSETCGHRSKKRTYYATDKGKAAMRAHRTTRTHRKRTNNEGTPYVTWLRELKLQEKFNCHWCGRITPTNLLNVDHAIPLSKGGCDGLENVVASCKSCNCKKNDKDLIVWLGELCKMYMDRESSVLVDLAGLAIEPYTAQKEMGPSLRG